MTQDKKVLVELTISEHGLMNIIKSHLYHSFMGLDIGDIDLKLVPGRKDKGIYAETTLYSKPLFNGEDTLQSDEESLPEDVAIEANVHTLTNKFNSKETITVKPLFCTPPSINSNPLEEDFEEDPEDTFDTDTTEAELEEVEEIELPKTQVEKVKGFSFNTKKTTEVESISETPVTPPVTPVVRQKPSFLRGK